MPCNNQRAVAPQAGVPSFTVPTNASMQDSRWATQSRGSRERRAIAHHDVVLGPIRASCIIFTRGALAFGLFAYPPVTLSDGVT